MDSFNGDPDDAIEVPELTPMDQYDAEKGRIKGSISWLLCKAFQDNIPEEYGQPVHENLQGDLELKPVVQGGLTSADLYCKACANIFHDTSSQWKGHLSVMQSLSRKGVYVVDTNESGVTEQVLAQTSPFKLSSHLAVIEALMTAYCKEVVSIERVVQAVRQFASFHASSELPYDTEDALMFWLNKVCKRVWLRLDRNRISQEATQPPLVEDLLKDLNDGRSLGVLIYFYCPEAFSLQGLNVQEVVGIADSLYNLQEVIRFCRSWMPRCCLHLTLDDLFYTNENLKANLITFLSELFYNFEVSPVDCVKKPVMISPERSDDANVGGPTRSGQRSSPGKPPAVPISNVTKKSFHYATNSGSHPDLHSLASSPGVNVPPVRQPLLPRRLHNRHSLVSDMRRSRSLTSAEDRDLIRGSVRAWEEGSLPGTAITTNGTSSLSQDRSMAPKRVSSADVIAMSKDSATSSGTLLANVSIDSDASHDMTDNSIDISDLERHTRQSPGRGVHANDLELQSLSSRGTTAQSARNPHNPGHNPGPHKNPQESPAGYKVEPLMPAKLRPTKEKSSNHTKESERGDSQRKKSPVSPTKPLTLNLKPAKVTRDSDTDSTPDEAYQTPSTESVSFFGETTSSQPEATSSPAEQASEMPKAKGQAFFVNMDTMGNGVMGPPSQTTSFDRNKPVAQSFTLHDQIHTPEAARAAGIPVVDSHIPGILQTMRPGSMTRSSSDSSDQELKKIYADHRDSESKDKGMLSSPRPGYLNVAESQQSRVTNGPVSSSGKPSPKTSFAEMSSKRLSGDFSSAGLVQANGGISTGGTTGKSTKTPKKTTFAALPNQTTWQENAQKSSYEDGKDNGDDRTDSAQPLASELLNIRMRLEERRRQIENEKRKMGIQRNKQRQRVGKEAFIHVISKGKNGKELRGETAKIQEEKSPDSQPIKPEDAIDVEDEDEMPIPPYRPQGPVVEAEPDEAAPAERESKDRTPPKRPETRPAEVAEADVAAPAPRLPSPREKPVDSTSRLGRSFSREGIQDTINTVKKKWFGAEEKVETKSEPVKKEDRKRHEPKVKSVEGKEKKKPSSETQPKTSGRPTVRSRPISISQKDPSKKSSDTYNNSLEKLNTSLSELQGEIMKLSLEQEQIKSMAAKSVSGTDSPPFSSEPMKVIAASPPRIAPSPPRVVPSPPRQDPFYLYPHQSGSEPEYSAKPASVPVASQMSGLGSQVYMTGQQVAPQYAPGMQQQTFMPPPTQMPYGGPQNYGQVNVSGVAGYMQMPHPYHQGMPPGGAPYQHMFPQQHMYPTPMPQGTGYPQMYQGQNQYTTPPQMQYTQPVSADQVLPSPTQTMYQPLSASGSSARAATTVQSPMDIRGMMSDLQAAQNGAPGLDVQSLQSLSAQSPQSPQVLSGSGITSPTGTPGITSPGSVYSPQSGSPQQRSPPAVASPAEGDAAEDAGAATNQPNEGFFISFDSGSPRKQKPKLPSRNKKDATQKSSPNGKSSSSNGVTPDMAKAEPASSQPPKQTSPQRPAPGSPPGPPANVSPGVGFIVEEVSEDVPTPDKMEEKKKKIMEMQKKRREEQEKKRLQKEEKEAKKREKQRKKQEEAEQKKADEKARREAIYQQYLQRKTQQDVEEEAPEPPVVVRRQKGTKKKEARPKSCYPAIAATTNQDDVNSTSSPSHSSQEDLYRGRSPGPAGDFVRGKVLACSIPEGLDSMFGYGLGRLRVPSPNPKRAPSPSFRRPPSPSQPQPKSRNAGPKLFVKPNQKSNRHIIMNAISHCCLAGIVNQDVKTKVLNEISGSEAKHFLILFRDAGQQYRATYTYIPDREEIIKLSGVGPKQLTNKMIERFYKYNSGAKTFSEVTSTKHMSVSIDAVTIHNSLWQKKAPAQKRPQSHFSNF